MGCGKSKIKNISLTTKTDWGEDSDATDGDTAPATNDKAKQLWTAAAAAVKFRSHPAGDGWEGLDTQGVLPHSLLDTIPTSDLGESLDTRRIVNQKETDENKTRSAPVSANSLGKRFHGHKLEIYIILNFILKFFASITYMIML